MISFMRKIKTFFVKTFPILAALSALALLAGCWDRTEMNDLAIVTATTIDRTEDGQMEVAVELFIPKSFGGTNQGQGGGGGGGGGGPTGAKETMVTYHKGTNLADALSKLQAEMPRKIFWGSCKVFIFSERIAKEGIDVHLDFLLRHPQPRERAYVFISEGSAKSIIEQITMLERYSAETIREVADTGHGMAVTMKDLEEMLVSEDRDAVLPYLALKKEETRSGKESGLHVIIGTALFRGDRMVGTLSELTTRGLLWLREEIENYTISIQPENVEGEVAVIPVSTKVRKIPKISGGEWIMTVKVEAEGTAVKNGTTLDLTRPDDIKKVEQAYRRNIKGRIEKAIEESQELKSDVVHFGKEFHHKYPKEWKKVRKRWEEVFPEVKTEFVIDAHIRRQGYINQSVESEKR